MMTRGGKKEKREGLLGVREILRLWDVTRQVVAAALQRPRSYDMSCSSQFHVLLCRDNTGWDGDGG